LHAKNKKQSKKCETPAKTEAERGSKKSGDARAHSSSIIMISFLNKLPSAFIPERTRHNTLQLIIIYYTQNQQQKPAPKLISWVASIIIVNFLPGVVPPLLEISQHRAERGATAAAAAALPWCAPLMAIIFVCMPTKNYVNFPTAEAKKMYKQNTQATQRSYSLPLA